MSVHVMVLCCFQFLSNACFLFSRGFFTLDSSWEKAAAWFKRQNSSLRLGSFPEGHLNFMGMKLSFFSFHLKYFFLWKKITVCGIRLVWKGNIDNPRTLLNRTRGILVCQGWVSWLLRYRTSCSLFPVRRLADTVQQHEACRDAWLWVDRKWSC